MAVLPRYQRLGVQTAQPAQLDFANIRESARYSEAVGQSIDRMSSFVNQQLEIAVKQRGREIVAERGALPTLEQIQEGGGPRTLLAQEAYSVANRIASAEIENEAKTEISRILADAEKNLLSPTQVQQQFADLTDGFAATLSPLDPELAGLLRTNIASSANDAATRYGSFYSSKMAAIRAEQLNSDAEARANDLLSRALRPFQDVDGAVGFMPPVDMMAAVNAERDLLIQRGMPASRANSWAQSTYKDMVRENTLIRATTMPLMDLKATVEDVPTQPYPGMSYSETLTEYNRLNTIFNGRMSAAETDLRNFSTQIDEAYTILNSGGEISVQVRQDLYGQAEDLQGLFPEAMTAWAQFQENHEFVQGLRGMTVEELSTVYDELQGGIPGEGYEGLDTKLEIYRRDTAGKFLQAASTEAAVAAKQVLAAEQEFAAPLLRDLADAKDVFNAEVSSDTPDLNRIDAAISGMKVANESIPESQRDPEISELISDAEALRQTIAEIGGKGASELLALLASARGAEIPEDADLPPGITRAEVIRLQQRQEAIIRRAAQLEVARETEAEKTKTEAEKLAFEADKEKAKPLLDRITTAGNVLNEELGRATPNLAIVEKAMDEISAAWEQIPQSQWTEDLKQAISETAILKNDILSWREALPGDLRAQQEALRNLIIPEELPPGMTEIEYIALSQIRAGIIEGVIQAQSEAVADGEVLAFANANGVTVPDNVTGSRVVGQPVDFALAITNPDEFGRQIDTRFADLEYLQDRFNTTSQFALRPEERDQMSEILENATPGQVGLFLDSMARLGWDKAIPMLQSLDMKEEKFRVTVQLASLMDQGQTATAMKALRAMDLDKPTSFTPSNVDPAWRAATGGAFQNLPNTLRAVQDVAALLYAAGADPTDGTFDTDVYTTAINMALGNNRLEKINGQVVLFGENEAGVDVNNIQDYLDEPMPDPSIIVGPERFTLSDDVWATLGMGDWYPVVVAPGIYILQSGKGFSTETWGDDNGQVIEIDLYRMQSSLINRNRRQ